MFVLTLCARSKTVVVFWRSWNSTCTVNPFLKDHPPPPKKKKKVVLREGWFLVRELLTWKYEGKCLRKKRPSFSGHQKVHCGLNYVWSQEGKRLASCRGLIKVSWCYRHSRLVSSMTCVYCAVLTPFVSVRGNRLPAWLVTGLQTFLETCLSSVSTLPFGNWLLSLPWKWVLFRMHIIVTLYMC